MPMTEISKILKEWESENMWVVSGGMQSEKGIEDQDVYEIWSLDKSLVSTLNETVSHRRFGAVVIIILNFIIILNCCKHLSEQQVNKGETERLGGHIKI